jgi:hypothetical protein
VEQLRLAQEQLGLAMLKEEEGLLDTRERKSKRRRKKMHISWVGLQTGAATVIHIFTVALLATKYIYTENIET